MSFIRAGRQARLGDELQERQWIATIRITHIYSDLTVNSSIMTLGDIWRHINLHVYNKST